MKEKLKFMKGETVKQDELGPVLTISKIVIVPVMVGILFYFLQQWGIAHIAAALMLAGLGYYGWRNG